MAEFCSAGVVGKGNINRFRWPKYTHIGKWNNSKSPKTQFGMALELDG